MTKERNDLTDGEVATLISKAQGGDSVSFEQLYNAFLPLRSKVARRYMNRGVDNDDVRQEVDTIFCAAVMNYDPSKDPSPKRHIQSYTNLRACSFYKRQKRWLREQVAHYENFVELEELLIRYGRLDEITVSQEEDTVLSLDVINALKTLTPRQQHIVVMYFFSNMTQQEISEVIGIDRSNVSRALADIQDILMARIGGVADGV